MPDLKSSATLPVLALLATCGTAMPAHAQSWAEHWFDKVVSRGVV